MLARLWWKEGRTLAPIAATVGGAALILQYFVIEFGGKEKGNGVLIALGVGWAILYALVASSASFAGEREMRTLDLLDALPVGRSTLWVGKATFALLSSLALALFLGWLGWLGSNGDVIASSRGGIGPAEFLLVLVEATAWGLLWSAVCRGAIQAGIMAVVSVGVEVSVLRHGVEDVAARSIPNIAGHLGLIVGALALSWFVLTREFAPPRGARATRPGRAARTAPGSLGTVGPVAAAPPRRGLLPTPGFYALVWQTVREGRGTWGLALAVGVIPQLLSPGTIGSFIDPTFAILLSVLALLLLGTSVFGLDNTAGTRSFLDHQAVPPGTVWWGKVVPWAVGLLLFGAVAAVGSLAEAILFDGRPLLLEVVRNERGILAVGAVGLDAFGIGMLAGMMFTRRITAALVAGLLLLVMVGPQLVVFSFEMVPPWTLLLTPLALLGASRLWAGDWLANWGGWPRWGRLTGLVGVPGAVLVAAYITGRTAGITGIAPLVDREAPAYRTEQALLALEQGLADGQRRQNLLSPAARDDLALSLQIGHAMLNREQVEAVAQHGWGVASPDQLDYLRRNSRFVGAVRNLARNPATVDFGPAPAQFQAQPSFQLFWTLGSLNQLLMVDALERRAAGDFAGAWEDIRSQLQLADRFALGARSTFGYQTAITAADRAINQAVAWASDPKTPLAAIRAARASLAEVEAVPTPLAAIRGEAARAEENLDRPTAEWVDFLSARNDGPFAAAERLLHGWIIAPSWERERTRRIVRLIAARALKDAEASRLSRVGGDQDPIHQGGSALNTPLVDRVIAPFLVGSERDQSLALRRMLGVFLDLRAWQLTHDGRAPATLDAILPDESHRIPDDPKSYQGSTLRYAMMGDTPAGSAPIRYYILFSVGPDGRDNQGRGPESRGFEPVRPIFGEDLVFRLPAEPAGPPPAPVPPTEPTVLRPTDPPPR